MIRLLRFSVRHPWVIIGLDAALTLAAVCMIPGVRTRLDARALIPQGHPAMRGSDAAAEFFGQPDVVVLVLDEPRTGVYTPKALRLLAEMSAELARSEGIVPGSVISLATMPRLFIENDVIDLRPRLDRGTTPDDAAVRAIRRETAAMGFADDVLVAKNGRSAAIYAEVRPDADRARVSELVRELAAKHSRDGHAVHFSGTAIAQAALGESAARDLARLVPLVLLLIAAAFLLIFRHPAPAFVSLTEGGVSLLWTMGLMGLRGQAVFVTTLILPVILIVIGVTDDIYALYRYFRVARQWPERPAGELIVETFSKVMKPILWTAATTALGLLSLVMTGLEPQRVFGFYGALSVLFTTVMTFSLVPALLVVLNPRPRAREVGFPRLVKRAMDGLVGTLERIGPRRVLAAVLAIAVVSLVVAATRLRIEDNWVGNLPPTSDTARGDRAVNRLLAGTNTLELMFDSHRPQGFLDPAVLLRLGRVEEALAADPRVGAVQGLYDDVVRINAMLAGVSFQSFKDSLRRGERALTRAEIEQALMLLSSAGRSPRTERLDDEERRSRMTVFVRQANYSRMAGVLDTAFQSARETFADTVALIPFGDGWISYLTIKLLVTGQIVSIGFAVLTNAILLVFLVRSLRLALLAILPVILSILIVFAVLAATGTPLGTANSMFAAITLGIGVDYSIHFVAYWWTVFREAGSLDALAAAVTETGPAILTSATAVIAGFFVLAFSEVPPNRQLGLLICLSLAVCATMTLVLIPTLVLLRGERR